MPNLTKSDLFKISAKAILGQIPLVNGLSNAFFDAHSAVKSKEVQERLIGADTEIQRLRADLEELRSMSEPDRHAAHAFFRVVDELASKINDKALSSFLFDGITILELTVLAEIVKLQQQQMLSLKIDGVHDDLVRAAVARLEGRGLVEITQNPMLHRYIGNIKGLEYVSATESARTLFQFS